MKRNEDILGWITLVIAFIIYGVDGYNSNFGRFFNGMALGFFGRSIYLQLKERKK